MSDRRCSVCGDKEPDVLLAVAEEDGTIVDVVVGREPLSIAIRAGDLVCLKHAARTSDGRYVRIKGWA